MAKGCSQKEGIDYKETYAPVVRYTSIRYLIALAVREDMYIDQLDVVSAFLQGDIIEEIYVEQPEGFNDGTNNVCKLMKSLYGLKQSGRMWNIKLDKTLKKFGLKRAKSDPCIYFNKDKTIYLAIYVDDILLFWKNQQERDKIKYCLKKSFKIRDMGRPNSCIGINISYENNSIQIDQSGYIKQILKRFNMQDCKPAIVPSDPGQKLSNKMCSDDQSKDCLNIPYQEAVGCLLYLAQATRPDISFAVNDVSRFNTNYGKQHWVAVKRIMRYLRGTQNFKLSFKKDKCELQGYSDADWETQRFLGEVNVNQQWPYLVQRQSIWHYHQLQMKLYGYKH